MEDRTQIALDRIRKWNAGENPYNCDLVMATLLANQDAWYLACVFLARFDLDAVASVPPERKASPIYPVSCGSCKQVMNIELLPQEAKIARFCPICGERSLSWRVRNGTK